MDERVPLLASHVIDRHDDDVGVANEDAISIIAPGKQCVAVQVPSDIECLEAAAEIPSKSSGFKHLFCGSRRRKIIWRTILGVICAFTVFAAVFWLAIIPAIVNNRMEGLRIEIDAIHVLPDTSNGENDHFRMSMQYTLRNLPATGWDFELAPSYAQILYNQSEIGSFPMEKLNIPKSGCDKLTIQQSESSFTISNAASWTGMNQDLLNSTQVQWQMVMKVCLELQIASDKKLQLPCVKISKEISVKGMQSLHNVSISSLQLPSNLPGDKGIEVMTDTMIENPSAIAIHLGDVTFSMRYAYSAHSGPTMITVGYVIARNLTLKRGMNQVQLRGALMDPWLLRNISGPNEGHRCLPSGTVGYSDDGDQSKRTLHRAGLGQFFSRFIVNGESVPLLVTGLLNQDLFSRCGIATTSSPPPPSSTPPVKSVPWVNDLIKSVRLSVAVQHDSGRMGSIGVSDLSAEFLDFTIRFSSPLPLQPLVKGLVNARLSVPYPFPLRLESVRINMRVLRCPQETDSRCSNRSAGIEFGQLKSGWGQANSSHISRSAAAAAPAVYSVKSLLAETAIQVERWQEREYKRFVRDLVRYPEIYMLVTGTIDARIMTAATASSTATQHDKTEDTVIVEGLPFESVLGLNGLDSFRSNSTGGSNDIIRVVDNLDVYGTDTNGRLHFSIPRAFMKRRQNGRGRVGIQLDAPLQFELYHRPAVQDVIELSSIDAAESSHYTKENSLSVTAANMGFQLGTVRLPGLDLTNEAPCTDRLHNRLTNETLRFPSIELLYCPLSKIAGEFQVPLLERDDELCTDRWRCPARSFLTSYIGGHSFFGRGVTLSLRAVSSGVEDLELALPFMIIHNITLPGYMPASVPKSNPPAPPLAPSLQLQLPLSNPALAQPPYPFLRRIIISPGKNIINGRLWCWLDFYNPLRIPLRFYYIDVDTFAEDGQVQIGNLNLNFTQYDPFERKPGYQFSGYPVRHSTSPRDQYGPHASQICMEMGDCQVGPIDLPAAIDPISSSTNSVITNRLEVTFNINSASVRAFWRSISSRNSNDSITPVLAKGRVLLGMGAKPFSGPRRRDASRSGRSDDPYWHAADPQREPVVLNWLDFGQHQTPMEFRKLIPFPLMPRRP